MPKPSEPRLPSWQMRLVRSWFALLAAMIFVSVGGAQSTSQTIPQTAADNSDAAAKAAARKAKFEEARKRLEQGADGPLREVPSDPNQTLFVSPAKVNMLLGESHAFCVFDIEGRDLTTSAEWTLGSSGVAVLQAGPVPEVVSKSTGSVTLSARIGGRIAEAEINVLTGDQMTPGTVKWSAAQIPGFRTNKMVQAVPSARGPDMYVTERNEKGETLLRAFLSDGRQLWMKKLSAANATNDIAPSPKGGLQGAQPKP